VKPRPVVRYMVKAGFSHKAVRGKITAWRRDHGHLPPDRGSSLGAKVDHYLDAGKIRPTARSSTTFLEISPRPTSR